MFIFEGVYNVSISTSFSGQFSTWHLGFCGGQVLITGNSISVLLVCLGLSCFCWFFVHPKLVRWLVCQGWICWWHIFLLFFFSGMFLLMLAVFSVFRWCYEGTPDTESLFPNECSRNPWWEPKRPWDQRGNPNIFTNKIPKLAQHMLNCLHLVDVYGKCG